MARSITHVCEKTRTHLQLLSLTPVTKQAVLALVYVQIIFLHPDSQKSSTLYRLPKSTHCDRLIEQRATPSPKTNTTTTLELSCAFAARIIMTPALPTLHSISAVMLTVAESKRNRGCIPFPDKFEQTTFSGPSWELVPPLFHSKSSQIKSALWTLAKKLWTLCKSALAGFDRSLSLSPTIFPEHTALVKPEPWKSGPWQPLSWRGRENVAGQARRKSLSSSHSYQYIHTTFKIPWRPHERFVYTCILASIFNSRGGGDDLAHHQALDLALMDPLGKKSPFSLPPTYSFPSFPPSPLVVVFRWE